MPDYLCDKCGERGGTSVSTECASLPPVLVIQISRYIFDPWAFWGNVFIHIGVFSAANRNKKVTSPIQYPRELHETVLRVSIRQENKKADNLKKMIWKVLHESKLLHFSRTQTPIQFMNLEQ